MHSNHSHNNELLALVLVMPICAFIVIGVIVQSALAPLTGQ